MVIKMGICTGRILDETCNKNNEAYSDEILYAARSEAPRVEEQLLEVVASTHDERARKEVERFMASLYA